MALFSDAHFLHAPKYRGFVGRPWLALCLFLSPVVPLLGSLSVPVDACVALVVVVVSPVRQHDFSPVSLTRSAVSGLELLPCLLSLPVG